MKIILVRHGESIDDIEDCYGGMADFPLSDNGRATAQTLATRLAGTGIETIYSSPYARAAETARFIGEAIGCDLVTIKNLRERNSYGVLSGHNKARAKALFPEIFANLKGKPGDYYGGESVIGDEPVPAFDARVKEGFDKIVEMASGKNVIGIVTHGNVTRSIYRNILGIKGKVELDLLAMTTISQSSGSLSLISNEGVTVN